MARCSTCHRRLPAAGRCPEDGGIAPAASPAGLPPRVPRVPGYQPTKLLGTGGFGTVWDAADDAGEHAALKISHSSDAAARLRIEREVAVLARVGPPHVPALRGSGLLPDGRPYLAMERLHGRTLADEMERWPSQPALPVIQTLGAALLHSAAALHERQVVHRDFKPENVFLVGADDQHLLAKLMDFGLSRPPNAPAQDQTVTGPGAGTPEYMAPEQISGGAADPRSDVYALGVMLFELCTLRLPFTGERRELEYAHLSYRPPRPSRFARVPEALEEMILRCLAKDPNHRYADAVALRAAFSDVMVRLPIDLSSPHAPRWAPMPPTPTPALNRVVVLRSSERQKVVLIFAQGVRVSGVDLQGALEPFGGQLAHAQASLAVCAFTHRAGDNPGHRALAAAEAMVAKEMVERLIVDVGTVSSKSRPNGPPRLFSPMFSDATRYPYPTDPPGILLTAAASALLPSLPCEPAPDRTDHFVLSASATDDLQSRTVMQDAAAPLVGRAPLVRVLLSEATTALTDWRPRVASVLADPGLGKTRLAFELARVLRARVPGAEVIELRAREPLGSDADETFAELLRRTLELPAGRPTDGGREILGKRLGQVAKEVHAGAALLLGWISPDHPTITSLRSAPGVLRANMARAGLESIRRLASRKPVIVVLDDVHWADDALLDALEQATVSDLPLWVCAFGRPSFADSRPTWGQRAAAAHVERLGPLDMDSAAELARHLLSPATNVPEPVIKRLVERAQAMPLLLIDLVRGLRAEGLVRTQVGGVSYVATEVIDRLPDSPLVEWIAGRELDQLSSDLAAHARLVSLLSAEITVEEVQGVLLTMDRDLAEAFPMDARVGIERLKQMRLLVQHRSGRYSFRNAILREAVAKTVGEAQSTPIHRAALAYYRSEALPDSIRLPRLAWHAAQAGERVLAATTYLGLAESARGWHNYLEADLLYTHALAQLPAGDEDRRLLALKGRGIARYRLGRYADAITDLAQAEELAVKVGDAFTQADVMLDESTALDWLFEWHKSRDLAGLAQELVRGVNAPALQARVLLAVGRSFHRFNQDREAADLLREAARLAESIGDEGYEVRVSAGLLLGFLLPFLGLLDEAEEQLERTSRLAEAKGDELHLGALWNNRSCLWIARNDRERFMEDNKRVLAFARRMGIANLERNANLNCAYFLYWRAEFAAAEPFARRTIEMDARYFRQGGFRPEAAVLLSRILWCQGDQQVAAKLVAEIRSQQIAVRAEAQNELLLLPNDEMLLDMIELVIAHAGSAKWEPLLARARSVAQGQELIEVLEMAGLAASKRGDLENARRWWKEALHAGESIPNVMGERIAKRLAELE
jgi:serine/threonine protein kinase